MAISPASQFLYTATVHGGSGGWRGVAEPPGDPTAHPGLVGVRPAIELANGTITLRRSESWMERWRNPHYRKWHKPVREASFPVGSTLDELLEAGDVLTVVRTGTTDLGVMVFRGADLQAALGAVAHIASGTGVAIEEDPRAREARLYGLAERLQNPDTQLVWVDAGDPDLHAQIAKVVRSPGPRVVVAIAGGNPEDRTRLNNLLATPPLPLRHSSHSYHFVDPKFGTEHQWLEYIAQLPTCRPRDLWIRFTMGTTVATLREEEYGFVGLWHLFVLKVCRLGIPGELSQLAVVRDQRAVTKRSIIDSTERIASRNINIVR